MAGVGMQGGIKLEWFANVVEQFFGERPYQVGSSLKATLSGGGSFRDVDVRVILPDDEFDAMFGKLTNPRCLNLKWNAACLAFTALGVEMTGLPIDFQIDRQTEANEEYGDEPRSALNALAAALPAEEGE